MSSQESNKDPQLLLGGAVGLAYAIASAIHYGIEGELSVALALLFVLFAFGSAIALVAGLALAAGGDDGCPSQRPHSDGARHAGSTLD